MNILLVWPRTPDTFWSFSHVMPLVGRKSAFPPLGLLTVAAMLPREWSLRVVDLNVKTLTEADIEWADAVFISAMIVHEDSARGVIARANAKGKPVVAGGPLFTTAAERFPEAACCVVGEAEELMGELVSDLAAGRLKPRYQAEQRPDVRRTRLAQRAQTDRGANLFLIGDVVVRADERFQAGVVATKRLAVGDYRI